MESKNIIGHKIIDIIKEELHNDNPRIAFLPYKREMWNSMKTVYQAAVEDGLEVYVIPIVYFKRNPDMTLEKDHPRLELIDDVENTSFKELPNLNLDLIFFHNPYDEFNLVTYVHNKFHSKELKKIAPIAYIPYHGMESTTDLIVPQGVENADYVFAVSEIDKKNFLNMYPDKKVFAVGSPKEEAIRQYMENKKRIILIVNTLVNFLKNPRLKMKQYREIINKGDVVIFRPHPLMDETISSMGTEYQEEYNATMQFIKENAIIDRSKDVEKVISIADYMYIDGGSVEELWKQTKKPYETLPY